MSDRSRDRLFPALLKHWRRARGMSQLDLATLADVSARHVSFLETGRARPSREMVLRLGATLDVPLRDRNALLGAAGYAPVFREGGLGELSGAIHHALERIMAQHEPFPLVVFDGAYDILMMNHGAQALFSRLFAQPPQGPLNVLRLAFDPQGLRPFIEDWETLGHDLLSRLQREVVRNGSTDLQHLLSALLAYPGVPDAWRVPDFEQPSEPTLVVRLRLGDARLSFFTTLTVFNAPQNVTLEELRIESYFPMDPETERACRESSS